MDSNYQRQLKRTFGSNDPEQIIGRAWFARSLGEVSVAFRRAYGSIREDEELVYIKNLKPSTDALGFKYTTRGPSAAERRAILGEE